MIHIEGEDRGDIVLYALSTCVWCHKTRRLLGEIGVAHSVVEVDLLEGDEQDEVMEIVKRFNPSLSFPVLVIDGEEAILGYKPDDIRERLS